MLICDDHPAFARGLAGLLSDEESDIEVVGIAASGDEAYRLVRDLTPDCVLMDIRMPGGDGIAATRRIREVSPTTSVVVVTVSDEQADLYAALRAGASGYVVKDKDVAEIASAVRAACRGQLVIPGHLASSFLRDLEGSHRRRGEGNGDGDGSSASADDRLTDQEREILVRISRGETNKEIAASLHVSERTVRRRVEDLYAKLHLTDRIEAAVYAAHQGLGGRSQ